MLIIQNSINMRWVLTSILISFNMADMSCNFGQLFSAIGGFWIHGIGDAFDKDGKNRLSLSETGFGHLAVDWSIGKPLGTFKNAADRTPVVFLFSLSWSLGDLTRIFDILLSPLEDLESGTP